MITLAKVDMFSALSRGDSLPIRSIYAAGARKRLERAAQRQAVQDTRKD